MIDGLGRVAKVILTDGSQLLFKPLEVSGDRITGTDEENFRRSLHIQDIETVIYFKKRIAH